MNFKDLKKNLKKDYSDLKIIKIAILGDNSTQFLTQAIKGYGHNVGLNFDVFEADYDQVERQVFDQTSELYSFKPNFTIISCSSQRLINKFYKVKDQDKLSFADDQISRTEDMVEAISSKLDSKIIYFNYPENNDAVFGNYSNKVESSYLYQLRKLNFELMNVSRKLGNFFICDVSALQNRMGISVAFDAKFYISADMVYSLDFIPFLAKSVVDIILAVSGSFKKCLILDLDNTLWGGVVGDDGLNGIELGELGIGKAFVELQLWIKQLKERGIILAVCSKNDEANAREPFEKHPDMVLELEDIAVFVANWENKAENIKSIQSVLNIGLDSMVFLDDNPFEREMVRSFVEDITVPELPKDPAEYLDHMKNLNLFETASYSSNDSDRTRQYQQETKRRTVQKTFVNEEEFLKNLKMVSLVREFDDFTIPRISQLTQRSNQYNLRTIRYTEDDIRKIANSDRHYGLSFTLEDKFGDNGLISLIILEKKDKDLFIDTWIMSCRVLKRGMEKFVCNEVLRYAKDNGFERILGEYIPTAKNGLVKDHYKDLGFSQGNGLLVLDVKKPEEKEVFIVKKEKATVEI